MHYFYNLSSASGGKVPDPPTGLYPRTPLCDFRLHTPNLPTPGKILWAPTVISARKKSTQ